MIVLAKESLLAELAAPGIRSVRRNWPPILILQLAAMALLVCYYSNPSFRLALGQVAQAKENGGLVAAALAGAISAGLAPEAAKFFTGKLKKFDAAWLEKLAVTTFIYALIGVFVDILYRVQALAFGSGNAPVTLALKTAVDMLLFSPFISIPVACTLFVIYEVRYDPTKVLAELRDRFYRRRIAPSLLLCWCFWTPVLFCVYAFPVPLQFPIAMLGEAAWSVLFVFMNTQSGVEPVI